jgi:hypothetical protein
MHYFKARYPRSSVLLYFKKQPHQCIVSKKLYLNLMIQGSSMHFIGQTMLFLPMVVLGSALSVRQMDDTLKFICREKYGADDQA